MRNLLSKACAPIFNFFGGLNAAICEAEEEFNNAFGMDDSKATKADLDAVAAGYQEEFKTNPEAQAAARFFGVY